MQLQVVRTDEGHRLRSIDGGADVRNIELVNKFLAHLGSRCFSPATVRAYAYDLLNFMRFLSVRRATLAEVVPTDLFDYLDWQQRPTATARAQVVRLADRRRAAPISEPDHLRPRRGGRPLLPVEVVKQIRRHHLGERGAAPASMNRRIAAVRGFRTPDMAPEFVRGQGRVLIS